MLVNFENRKDRYNDCIWMGRYLNLINILHWHLESEIIRVVEGNARIMIDSVVYEAKKGDCFICTSNTLHYIEGEKDSVIDILIFNNSVLTDELKNLSPIDAYISESHLIESRLSLIGELTMQKPRFYLSKANAEIILLVSEVIANNNTRSIASKTNATDIQFYKSISWHENFASDLKIWYAS